MTCRFTDRVPPSWRTRTPSRRTGLFSRLALWIAARSGNISPSRAIFSRSKLAFPVGGSKYAPVAPRNCSTCSASLTRTPGGANWLTEMRSASRCALNSLPPGSAIASSASGAPGGRRPGEAWVARCGGNGKRKAGDGPAFREKIFCFLSVGAKRFVKDPTDSLPPRKRNPPDFSA